MKAKRIINMVVWLVVAVALVVYVCLECHRQGCGWQSLVLAISFYGVLSAGLWYAVDEMIRDRYRINN